MITPLNIKNGELVCESFKSSVKKCRLVEWNYRDTAGVLHTGICKSIGEAKLKARKFGYFVNIEECVI